MLQASSEVLEDLQVLNGHGLLLLPVIFGVSIEVGRVPLVRDFGNYGRLGVTAKRAEVKHVVGVRLPLAAEIITPHSVQAYENLAPIF